MTITKALFCKNVWISSKFPFYTIFVLLWVKINVCVYKAKAIILWCHQAIARTSADIVTIRTQEIFSLKLWSKYNV